MSGSRVAGADAGNYTVNSTANGSADITARALSVSAVADTKTYDGTAGSSATPAITGIVAPGDSAYFAQSFDNRNAGTGKTLTASGVVSDGNSGHNYSVTFATVSTGSITAKGLTVTGITASGKTYDVDLLLVSTKSPVQQRADDAADIEAGADDSERAAGAARGRSFKPWPVYADELVAWMRTLVRRP